MNQEKLQSVLKVHQLWLETRFSAHIEGCRADSSFIARMIYDAL